MIEELRELLDEMVDQSPEAGFEPSVHLWILLFGGVHAIGNDDTWYRKEIRKFCDAEILPEWKDVKLLITGLPWVNDGVEEILRKYCASCSSPRS